MTSTAEPLRPATYPSWVRTALVLVVLALFATQSQLPWGMLWLVVPCVVAVSLLVGWRFGTWGVAVPAVLFAAALTISGIGSLWVWWIPAAALTGVWMGLREEGLGPSLGMRAWMLLPILLLAVGMPWLPHYASWIRSLETELRASDRQFLDLLKELGMAASRIDTMAQTLEGNAKLRGQALPHVVPTAVFSWIALLVAAGRTIAGRTAGVLHWPALSRGRLAEWRLPDGAVWLFLAGLALAVAGWSSAVSASWTLLLNTGLGFCIQGIAVVESLLLARGVPPAMILATFVFVFVLAMPVFMLTTVAVGLSDVWLDYRRMEAPRDSKTS